jgi:hypothetical protein
LSLYIMLFSTCKLWKSSVNALSKKWRVTEVPWIGMYQWGTISAYWLWLYTGDITRRQHALWECTIQAEPWNDTTSWSLWNNEEWHMELLCQVCSLIFVPHFSLSKCQATWFILATKILWNNSTGLH